MAGLRPGFGRGGITHSFEVTEPGVPGPGDGATDGRAAKGAIGAMAGAGVIDTPVVAILVMWFSSSSVLRVSEGICKSGGLGTHGTGSEERKDGSHTRRVWGHGG